jgi:hypothetical protein
VPRRLAAAHVDVVAVKRDVELAEGDLAVRKLADAPPEPLGEWHTSRVDADQRDPGEVGVALDDLVGDPCDRLRDRIGVEDSRRCRGLGGYVAVRA